MAEKDSHDRPSGGDPTKTPAPRLPFDQSTLQCERRAMATNRLSARLNVTEPRFIRLRDAPGYLGMDKNRFNREVRPKLLAIPIGTQGIAFDRLDLDTWADEYKSRNGHPAAQPERGKLWETKERQASLNAVGSGTSISSSEEHAFAKALEQATSGKPRSISRSG